MLYAHFPTSNLAGVHLARLFVQYFKCTLKIKNELVKKEARVVNSGT